MHPALTVYQERVFDVIRRDFEIETWADDCLFTEGPVFHPDGYYLFSDIQGNCVYRIEEGKKKEVFIANSGTDHPSDPDLKPDQIGSNALAFDARGRLLVCQHGSHAIAEYDGQALQPYIDRYNGRPLNSPNDFIIHEDGRIYFSDPPYGLKDGKLNPEKFQALAGVYCWKDGALSLVCDKYQYPNGVVLSPDGNYLYICSNKPFERFISRYDTRDNTFVNVFTEENSDGIECDAFGNIYLCNKDGLIILDGQGARMALIQLPTIPANICWGRNGDLFVTARQNIFVIKGLLQ